MESETRLGARTEDYRTVVERIQKRAQEHRDGDVRTLGRLVRVLRERTEITREQLGGRTGLNPQWLMMLENELLVESDISKARLRRLGGALGVVGDPDITLAEASGLNYSQIPERARPLKRGFRVYK